MTWGSCCLVFSFGVPLSRIISDAFPLENIVEVHPVKRRSRVLCRKYYNVISVFLRLMLQDEFGASGCTMSSSKVGRFSSPRAFCCCLYTTKWCCSRKYVCMCVLTTFSFFTASSQTCIPLDSSTSTNPRYCNRKRAEVSTDTSEQALTFI